MMIMFNSCQLPPAETSSVYENTYQCNIKYLIIVYTISEYKIFIKTINQFVTVGNFLIVCFKDTKIKIITLFYTHIAI